MGISKFVCFHFSPKLIIKNFNKSLHPNGCCIQTLGVSRRKC